MSKRQAKLYRLSSRSDWAHAAQSPTYIIFSGADENVPPSVDKLRLVTRFKQALGPLSRSTIVEGANHELDGHAAEMTKLVEAFLANLTSDSS